jgi:hypothetical protein
MTLKKQPIVKKKQAPAAHFPQGLQRALAAAVYLTPYPSGYITYPERPTPGRHVDRSCAEPESADNLTLSTAVLRPMAPSTLSTRIDDVESFDISDNMHICGAGNPYTGACGKTAAA